MSGFTYIKTPTTISLSTITTNDLTLSASQLVELVMPNKNYLYVKDFLSRQLKKTDLGEEVGSLNYICRRKVFDPFIGFNFVTDFFDITSKNLIICFF